MAGRDLELGSTSTLRLIEAPERALKLHYETFSNPLLWFLQHGLCDLLTRSDL